MNKTLESFNQLCDKIEFPEHWEYDDCVAYVLNYALNHADDISRHIRVDEKTPEEGILINDLKSEIRDIIRNGSYDHWSDICDAVLVPDDDEIRERFYQQILGAD